jgi:hypothetical protein
MSQIYRVELKDSLSESFDLSDSVKHTLNLTPIIELSEMLDLLEAILEERGFKRVEGEVRRLTRENTRGEQVTFDLEQQEVIVSLSEREELSVEVVAGGHYDEDFVSRSEGEQRTRLKLDEQKSEAHATLEAHAERRQRALTQKLSESVDDQRRELNEILRGVYAESVKRKAAQLGEVMEISESTDNGQYELVIKIER